MGLLSGVSKLFHKVGDKMDKGGGIKNLGDCAICQVIGK